MHSSAQARALLLAQQSRRWVWKSGGGTNINRFSVFFSEPQNYGGVKVSPSPPSNDGSSLALDGIEVGEHFLLSCVPGYIDRSAQAHFFMAQNHKGSVFLWWLIIPFEFERQNVFDYLIIWRNSRLSFDKIRFPFDEKMIVPLHLILRIYILGQMKE